MILPLSNGVQQLTGLGWAWQWSALGGSAPPAVASDSRVIRLVAGGGRVQRLTCGGAGVVKLAAGGNVPRRLGIGAD